MTPRYEYTWGGGNFFLAASLRIYCYAHCWCTSVGKKATSRKSFTVWQFLRNHELVLRGDGSIGYGKRRPLSYGMYDKTADVFPAQTGGGNDTGAGDDGSNTADTCGADGKQFCPAEWPEAELGPIPKAPPFSKEIVAPPAIPDAPASVQNDLTMCGNKCTGSKDCTPTSDMYSCECAFPIAADASLSGLDPSMPPSVCLSLFTVNSGLHSSLIGRGV